MQPQQMLNMLDLEGAFLVFSPRLMWFQCCGWDGMQPKLSMGEMHLGSPSHSTNLAKAYDEARSAGTAAKLDSSHYSSCQLLSPCSWW